MKSEKGMAIIKELIRKSDVVTENFSAGVFEKWGFTYENLSILSPGIIYMSISGLGHSGRRMMYGTWGPTAAALSGMTYISGLPDHHPCGWGYSYLDIIAGYTGAYSILTALYHKKRTGKGQYIDISQVETAMHLAGANLLDFTVNGRSSQRSSFPTGNRSVLSPNMNESDYRGAVACPHNIYRCVGGGKNDWCAIAVYSDMEWERFKEAIGEPEWSQSERFDHLSGRIQYQDELDQAIQTYTLQYNKYELMSRLQSYGIACGAVQENEDIVEKDQQLQYRGLFEQIEHPLLGLRKIEGIPIKMSENSAQISKAAPLMGEDNEYVYGSILGYSNEEIKSMVDAGTLWPVDMPKESFKAVRPLW
jgi:crotonobetainyl-CoA:carnitine CoA-transferase CaiB-like acyl-CoA transferase